MNGPIRPADRPGGLLTSVVGSHARPSWFVAGIEAAERGAFGPVDLAEMLDDGVDLAIRDQETAGIDVVSDGEMRRAGFFTAEFYRHLTGVRARPSDRRLGAGGHDQQHRFDVLEPIAAPDGLGVVEEFRFAVTRASRPLKVTIPGPYTLSGRLSYGPDQVYRQRNDAAEAFVPILRAELEGLVDAGATFIQIDDPSPAIHPEAPSDFAALFNASVEPVVGRVRLGAHLCFGNYLGRPLSRRTYRPVLDAMLGFRVDELVLEFANREMAEVAILGEIAAAGRDVAAGVVDVKNYHLESADEVAERIDQVLAAGVPAERLALVPDCGFSQTARWATTAKLRALVAGRDLVLGRTGRTARAMTATPTDAGVLEAAGRVQLGEWTSVALTEACLERIEALEPAVRAWAHLDAAAALAEAADRDADVRAGRPLGPLHGVPIGIKDLIDVAGMPTTAGAATFAHTATDARRDARRAAAGGRRGDRRQDPCHPVRLSRPGAHPQSLVPRTHAGRVVVGIGSRGRCPDDPSRDRHPDRRLDPAPRRRTAESSG